MHDPGQQQTEQYQSRIFFNTKKEEELARKQHGHAAETLKSKSIQTQIQPLNKFQKADETHQNYY